MTRNLPQELRDHQDEWTALTWDDRLVGYGKTPEEAIASADKNGHRDIILFFAAKCLFDGSVLVF